MSMLMVVTDTPRHALEPSDDPVDAAAPAHALPADDAAGDRPLFRETLPQPDGPHLQEEPAPEHLADTVADTDSEPTRALPPVDADVPVQPEPVAPVATTPAVVSARGFGVKTHDPAFTDLDIEVPAGRFAAVVGAAGTGKSTLLLALVARMRPVVGSLSVGGLDARKHPGKVRGATAIARIADLVEPENSLTLDDCLTERTLFDAADPRTREANYLHAARLLGLDAHRGTLFGDLSPIDQTRAALALACVRPSTVIVLDDLDYDVTLAEQRALWDGVAALAADGQPVIAATTERSAVHPDAVVIDLEPEA